MDNCIFCKIVAGEISSYKIAENNNFLAFLDIKPFAVGHVLIVPKKHYRWTYDVPEFSEMWQFTHQVTQKILINLNPKFVNYLTMGNQVEHSHLHIIPRYQDDALVSFFDQIDKFRLEETSTELLEIAAKIKS